MEPEVSISLFHIENLYGYIKARKKLEIRKEEIYSISYALEKYYEQEGKYPKNLKNLVPDYLDKLPENAADYNYRIKGEGNQVFILEAKEDIHREAGIRGKYPAYRGEEGKGDFVPCSEEIPESAYPDWLLAGAVKDREKIETFISEKSIGEITEKEYKNQKIITINKGAVNYCLTEKFIIVSSKGEFIENSLDVYDKEKDNIKELDLYKKFSKKISTNSLAYIFVNLEKILPHICEDLGGGQWNELGIPTLNALKSLGIIASGTSGGLQIDTYLNIDKSSKSPLNKAYYGRKYSSYK